TTARSSYSCCYFCNDTTPTEIYTLSLHDALPIYGKDIIEIGKKLVAEEGDKWASVSVEERIAYFKEYGLKSLLGKIEEDLADFRVHFDHWFSERSLYKDNQITDVLGSLKDGKYTYEQ